MEHKETEYNTSKWGEKKSRMSTCAVWQAGARRPRYTEAKDT